MKNARNFSILVQLNIFVDHVAKFLSIEQKQKPSAENHQSTFIFRVNVNDMFELLQRSLKQKKTKKNNVLLRW